MAIDIDLSALTKDPKVMRSIWGPIFDALKDSEADPLMVSLTNAQYKHLSPIGKDVLFMLSQSCLRCVELDEQTLCKIEADSMLFANLESELEGISDQLTTLDFHWSDTEWGLEATMEDCYAGEWVHATEAYHGSKTLRPVLGVLLDLNEVQSKSVWSDEKHVALIMEQTWHRRYGKAAIEEGGRPCTKTIKLVFNAKDIQPFCQDLTESWIQLKAKEMTPLPDVQVGAGQGLIWKRLLKELTETPGEMGQAWKEFVLEERLGAKEDLQAAEKHDKRPRL